jgi:hypothetical protein
MGTSKSILNKQELPYIQEESILKDKAEIFWKKNCEIDGFEPYWRTCQWEVIIIGGALIIFKNSKGKCFCTYLFTKTRMDGMKEIEFNFEVIDLAMSHNNEYKLGTINMSAQEIIHKGYTILCNSYNGYKMIDNCEDFCVQFAEELGCKDCPLQEISNATEMSNNNRHTYYVLIKPIKS